MIKKLIVVSVSVFVSSTTLASTDSSAQVQTRFPATWHESATAERWQCEIVSLCDDLEDYLDRRSPPMQDVEKEYGKLVPVAPPARKVVAIKPAPIARVEIKRRIECEPICHHIVTYSDGSVEIIPEYKIHPKVAMIRNAMTQLTVKGVAVVSGPLAPVTTTITCGVLNSDFDTNTAKDVGMNFFGCSPPGFIEHQKYAVNDAHRAFIWANGLVGLAGLGGLPLPGPIYMTNELAGTFSPLINWENVSGKKKSNK